MSDAYIVAPGGVGTLLETAMIWQLLQVQKLHNTPLILAGKMYADLVEWCKTYMLRSDCPLASPADMSIPICVDNAAEAVAIIRKRHAEWLVAHPAAMASQQEAEAAC